MTPPRLVRLHGRGTELGRAAHFAARRQGTQTHDGRARAHQRRGFPLTDEGDDECDDHKGQHLNFLCVFHLTLRRDFNTFPRESTVIARVPGRELGVDFKGVARFQSLHWCPTGNLAHHAPVAKWYFQGQNIPSQWILYVRGTKVVSFLFVCARDGERRGLVELHAYVLFIIMFIHRLVQSCVEVHLEMCVCF